MCSDSELKPNITDFKTKYFTKFAIDSETEVLIWKKFRAET